MEDSSTSKEMTTETPTVYHPSSFLEALSRAILKCLGFDIIFQNCSSTPEQKVGHSPQESSSSNADQQNADPPSTTTLEPPADPPTVDNIPAVLAKPPRPDTGTGSGPQIN